MAERAGMTVDDDDAASVANSSSLLGEARPRTPPRSCRRSFGAASGNAPAISDEVERAGSRARLRRALRRRPPTAPPVGLSPTSMPIVCVNLQLMKRASCFDVRRLNVNQRRRHHRDRRACLGECVFRRVAVWGSLKIDTGETDERLRWVRRFRDDLVVPSFGPPLVETDRECTLMH